MKLKQYSWLGYPLFVLALILIFTQSKFFSYFVTGVLSIISIFIRNVLDPFFIDPVRLLF